MLKRKAYNNLAMHVLSVLYSCERTSIVGRGKLFSDAYEELYKRHHVFKTDLYPVYNTVFLKLLKARDEETTGTELFCGLLYHCCKYMPSCEPVNRILTLYPLAEEKVPAEVLTYLEEQKWL